MRILRVISPVLVTLALVVGCGGPHEQDNATRVKPPHGRWAVANGDTGTTSDTRDMLAALHYLPGYEPPPERAGVTVNDSDLAHRGLNLTVSGHAPAAVLADMNGNELARWTYHLADVWKGHPPAYLPEAHDTSYTRNWWRRARLLDDGSLLAVFGGLCLIKLDRGSRMSWAYPFRAHHDMDFDPQGNILTLIRETRVRCDVDSLNPIVEDFVVVLSPDGAELERLSLVDCFLNSAYRDLLKNPRLPDILHTNSIRRLDDSQSERSPLFSEGNLLLSFRDINTIGIIDPAQMKVIWAATGPWVAQHDATLLPNGNIMLFDNLGDEGSSRVLELDPLSGEIEWTYEGTAEHPFSSETCGACQRLPNGNTLITETDSGRAFEVTPDGTIVWEYINPHRAGEHRQLIATLLDVVRITERPAWLPD